MSEYLEVVGSGAVTAVGLDAAQSCAAIRAGISSLRDAYQRPPPDDPIVGARIPGAFRTRISDADWLASLAARAIEEALGERGRSNRVALVANLPEANRRHPALDAIDPAVLLMRIQERVGTRFVSAEFLQAGHAGFYPALERARVVLANQSAEACCVGGVDSLLNRSDIDRLTKGYRLRLPEQSWGLSPGEGAAFVLVAREDRTNRGQARISGVGVSTESDTLLGARYSQARGLAKALQLAVEDAGSDESKVVFRVSDANGERYRALESVMLEARFYRSRRARLPCWIPAPSVGDVGAAAGALSVIVASAAFVKGYAPGPIAMCEGSSDEGLRGACLIHAHPLAVDQRHRAPASALS